MNVTHINKPNRTRFPNVVFTVLQQTKGNCDFFTLGTRGNSLAKSGLSKADKTSVRSGCES